jgi:hypothetical protein
MSPSPIGPTPTRPPRPRPTQPTRPRAGLLPVAGLASVLVALDKGRRGPRPPARHPGGRTCRDTLLLLPFVAVWVALRALLPAGRSPGPVPRVGRGTAPMSAGRAGGWPAEGSPPAASP